MSEIRFLSSSDEHLRDISPGFRKDDYRSAILKKITWQGDMARRFSASAVLRGGDFFDVKAANKTTMRTLSDAARIIHDSYPCKTYVVPGNHDMSHNDPTSIPHQPLGVLYSSGTFLPLKDETFVDGSLSVRVIGVEYTTGMEDGHLRELIKKDNKSTYTIAVVHALAGMAPEEKIQSFFGERIFDYRDLVFNGCPDLYIFGHYHKDQGIQNHLGVYFVNLGAISRGALTFENMDRKPKISLIKCNSQGLSVEECIVPHDDASRVFDFEKKKQIEKERKSLNDFIMKLRSNSVSSDDDIRFRIQELRQSNIASDLKEMIEGTLEAVESGCMED